MYAKDPSQIAPANPTLPVLASLITDDFVAVASVQPEHFWQWPAMQKLFAETHSEELVEEEISSQTRFWPADPRKARRVTVLFDNKILQKFAESAKAERPEMITTPFSAAIVEMANPINWEDFHLPKDPPPEIHTHQGLPYVSVVGPAGQSGAIATFGDRYFVMVSKEETLKRMLEQTGRSSKMGQQFASAPASADAVVLVNLEAHRELAEDAATLHPLAADLPNVSTLFVSANPQGAPGDSLLTVRLTARDAAAAEAMETKYSPMLDQAKAMYQQITQGLPMLNVPELNELVSGVQIQRAGNQLTVDSKIPDGLYDKLIEVLTPAIAQARIVAQKVSYRNNLKQIILAFHTHHDSHNSLPPTGSGEGVPKLSWRVHLLPYLDNRVLYGRFDLEAAWDSPQNMALLKEMPEYFQSPGVEDPGMTSYHVFDGPGAFLDSKEMIGFGQITDGLSNTTTVFLAGPDKAEPWTKPGGLPFGDDVDLIKALGNIPGETIDVVLADGRAIELPKDIDPKTLRALITRNGGETFTLPGQE